MQPTITPDMVRHGLADGEFHLKYMPTINLADGRCVGAEALSRWQRPTGPVSPADFVPIIEQTPVAGLLTYWVIETIARELGDWLRGNDHVHVGINAPPDILGRGGFEYALTRSGLMNVCRQLIVEVTERGLPDQQGLDSLAAATKSGIRIALDDVDATGINLALFSRGPVNILKLDRSLICQIVPRAARPEWLGSVQALVRSTSVLVIAEGVETIEQVDALREAGVHMVQGYHYSKPISADELPAFHDRTMPH